MADTGKCFGMNAEAFARHLGRLIREHTDRKLAPLLARLDALERERDELLALIVELRNERTDDDT